MPSYRGGYQDEMVLLRRRLAVLRVEAERRAAAKRESVPDLRADLFDKQQAVWDSPHQTRLVLGSRRSGKSELIVRWLLDGAMRTPGYLCPYIAQSRKNAKLIAWEALKRVLREHSIDATVNEADLTARLPNGSSVILGGCNDRSEVDRWRGLKCARVAIDECGAMPYLAELVDTVRPSLMDVGGPMMLAGNPGLVWGGLWYELTGSARSHDLPVHHWTLFDNPHIPAAHEEAQRYKAERGWDDDHPTWLREYLGQWARDTEAQVFPWDPQDSAPTLPTYESPWRYVLSIDVGQVNANGYTLWAAHANDPHDYVVKSWRSPGQLIDSMADDIRSTWAAIGGKCPVVMDTGGMGKQHAEELIRRKGIGIIAAEKRDKQSALRVLGDRLKSHGVRVLEGPQNDAIRDDWARCQWNDKRTDIAEDSKDPTSHRDVAHAGLYGHRFLRNYLYKPLEDRPQPGTPEHSKQTEDKILQEQLRRYKRTQRPIYDR